MGLQIFDWPTQHLAQWCHFAAQFNFCTECVSVCVCVCLCVCVCVCVCKCARKRDTERNAPNHILYFQSGEQLSAFTLRKQQEIKQSITLSQSVTDRLQSASNGQLCRESDILTEKQHVIWLTHTEKPWNCKYVYSLSTCDAFLMCVYRFLLDDQLVLMCWDGTDQPGRFLWSVWFLVFVAFRWFCRISYKLFIIMKLNLFMTYVLLQQNSSLKTSTEIHNAGARCPAPSHLSCLKQKRQKMCKCRFISCCRVMSFQSDSRLSFKVCLRQLIGSSASDVIYWPDESNRSVQISFYFAADPHEETLKRIVFLNIRDVIQIVELNVRRGFKLSILVVLSVFVSLWL